MCVNCHLSPGVEDSEVRKGLYPKPPSLASASGETEKAQVDAQRSWTIKHGIKASGMASWSKGGLQDSDIWGLTAFLRILLNLSASLLPIMWGHGAGSEVMRRIAAPMMGGMISSTMLTLVVIPAIYASVNSDDSSGSRRRGRWSLPSKRDAGTIHDADRQVPLAPHLSDRVRYRRRPPSSCISIRKRLRKSR